MSFFISVYETTYLAQGGTRMHVCMYMCVCVALYYTYVTFDI